MSAGTDPGPGRVRAPAVTGRAMIATSQAPATTAGLRILERGGNAADAAVAAAAALCVTEPMSTHLGGNGRCKGSLGAPHTVRELAPRPRGAGNGWSGIGNGVSAGLSAGARLRLSDIGYRLRPIIVVLLHQGGADVD
jgi:hypothetical protein